jgi:hypothetical protein
MALRQAISKVVMPNFERDVTRVVQKEVDSVLPFMNQMMTPSAYGYTATSSQGAFHSSGLRQAASSARVKRMDVPIKHRGLFEKTV